MTRPSYLDRKRGAAPIAIVVVVAATALALVVTVNALSSYKTSVAQKRWDEALGSRDEIMRRYPATEANRSALELERLAARLGIDIVPRQSERREELRSKSPSRLDPEIRASYYVYLKSQTERPRRGEIDAPPQELQAYIAGHDDELIALRRHLIQSDVPVWESDFSRGAAAPLPNLLGHIDLQKLLAGVALARLHTGDTSGALADVEAARRLSRSLRDSPIVINQLILLAGARLQLGVLRQIPDVDEIWLGRLAEHDFRESFITSMKFEGWLWLSYSETAGGEESLPLLRRVATPLTRPYNQLCRADLSDAWRERVMKLEQVDALCDRDLTPYGADLDIPIPRWNVIGKHVVPGLSGAIDRLARYELDQELTQLMIEADAQRRANGGSWPESYVTERASVVCPDDRWNYSTNGEELEIALSRNVQWPDQKGAILPTRSVLP